jgi:hypothetical protein
MKQSYSILFASVLTVALTSCTDKLAFWPHEGVARIEKFTVIPSELNDSCLVICRVLVEAKKKYLQYTLSSHILITKENNDTIVNEDVWQEGINLKIPQGQYNLFISSYGCKSLSIEGLPFKPNEIYDTDFVLIKGSGVQGYTISY